ERRLIDVEQGVEEGVFGGELHQGFAAEGLGQLTAHGSRPFAVRATRTGEQEAAAAQPLAQVFAFSAGETERALAIHDRKADGEELFAAVEVDTRETALDLDRGAAADLAEEMVSEAA